MYDLVNLKATNGECIADTSRTASILKLHCVEFLGDEYTKSKRYAGIWIPTNKKSFWIMIYNICLECIGSDSFEEEKVNQFEEIRNEVEKIIRMLDE